MLKRLLLGLTLLALPFTSFAQEVPLPLEVPLSGVTAYDSAIPKPEDVIGHQIGTWHTEPSHMVDYFEAVAAVSDRVVLQEYARSYQKRPLIHAIVTSPANHARLEAIRQANLRLSDTPSNVADDTLDDMPAVVYMGYSVHGNEASGSEAALLFLYHLAAGSGPAVASVLDDLVVIIDPNMNPDGRARFATWVNQNRGMVANTDPQDREHIEPWPGGRTNHFWFDLNRDWLPVQHPESQGRIELFHHWRPQVLTDFHEMGGNATYFFQPGIPSRTNPNTPALNQELTAEIATYHARALDNIGALYYTRESFDDFYYGKGSTYPDVNGSIGILFEQASSRALLRDTNEGVLDYAYTVRNQFLTSLSTVEALVNMRTQLLAYQRDFYAEAVEHARRNPVKAYVFGTERGHTRAQVLMHILQQHRVEVHRLARDVESEGKQFEAGEAYIIPMNQPQTRFIKAIMERTTTFTDSLFYDVSTWTLPLAFDLDYAELRQNASNYVGERVETVELDGGELIGGTSSYGYVMRWGRYFAPRALYKLMEAGIRPRLLNTPFTAIVGGEAMTFDQGSVFIATQTRDASAGAVAPEQVHALVRQIVDEDHVQVYAVDTGLTPDGPDLGGRLTSLLEKPEIALITGSGSSAYNAGEVWHLLNERFDIPLALLDASRVGSADLDRYNTIILAGGFYSGLSATALQEWVRDGGRLIASSSAVDWLRRNEMLSLEAKQQDLDSLFHDLPYNEVGSARGAQVIGGSIFEARVDQTHPLAYGLDATLPVFRNSNRFFEPSETPGTNVAVYTESPLLSGYISEEKLMLAPNSAAVVANRMGRGRVVAILDNPNFRAFWYGTNALFLNAVFFGGSY